LSWRAAAREEGGKPTDLLASACPCSEKCLGGMLLAEPQKLGGVMGGE